MFDSEINSTIIVSYEIGFILRRTLDICITKAYVSFSQSSLRGSMFKYVVFLLRQKFYDSSIGVDSNLHQYSSNQSGTQIFNMTQ
jgi:hypothetical protein